MAIANYENFNAGKGGGEWRWGVVLVFLYCLFANGYKLSSLEADRLYVEVPFMKEKISLLGFYFFSPFFDKLYVFFQPC